MEDIRWVYVAGFLDGDGSVILQHVIAKRAQVEEAIALLSDVLATPKPSPEKFLAWAQRVESYQALNYSKKRKYTAEDVRRFLSSKGLLPPP